MRIVNTNELTQRDNGWYYQDRYLSDTERNWIYNGLDAMVTHEVAGVLRHQFDNVTRSAYEFEKELMGPILEMNMRGVLIDEEYRHHLIADYIADMDRVEDNLNRILNEGLGVYLNWRSNPGLLDLFYNVLGLEPVRKRNGRGDFVPTVNRDALEQLEDNFYAKPIVTHILSLRDLGKRISFLRRRLTQIEELGLPITSEELQQVDYLLRSMISEQVQIFKILNRVYAEYLFPTLV